MAHALGLLVAGALIGALVYFTAAVAPTAFRVLPREQAGRLVGHMFPTYYLILAVGAAAAAMLVGFTSPAAGRILAGVAALFMAMRLLLLPRMAQLRDLRDRGDATARRTFARLHGLSMALNLIGGGALVAAFLIAV